MSDGWEWRTVPLRSHQQNPKNHSFFGSADLLEFSHVFAKKVNFFHQNGSKIFSTHFQTPMKISNMFLRSWASSRYQLYGLRMHKGSVPSHFASNCCLKISTFTYLPVKSFDMNYIIGCLVKNIAHFMWKQFEMNFYWSRAYLEEIRLRGWVISFLSRDLIVQTSIL